MSTVLETLRSLHGWDPGQRSLRAVVLAGPVVALLAAGAAGNGPAAWVLVLVVVLSVLWAGAPESAVGTGALLVVLFWWTRVPDDALHPAALLAALAVVASHVAAVVGSVAPPRTPVDPAVLRLWSTRAALLLLPVPVLWVLARALRGEDAPSGLWPAGLAVTLLAVVLLGAALGRRDDVV